MRWGKSWIWFAAAKVYWCFGDLEVVRVVRWVLSSAANGFFNKNMYSKTKNVEIQRAPSYSLSLTLTKSQAFLQVDKVEIISRFNISKWEREKKSDTATAFLFAYPQVE